jgi:hypothetical protein
MWQSQACGGTTTLGRFVSVRGPWHISMVSSFRAGGIEPANCRYTVDPACATAYQKHESRAAQRKQSRTLGPSAADIGSGTYRGLHQRHAQFHSKSIPSLSSVDARQTAH